MTNFVPGPAMVLLREIRKDSVSYLSGNPHRCRPAFLPTAPSTPSRRRPPARYSYCAASCRRRTSWSTLPTPTSLPTRSLGLKTETGFNAKLFL